MLPVRSGDAASALAPLLRPTGFREHARERVGILAPGDAVLLAHRPEDERVAPALQPLDLLLLEGQAQLLVDLAQLLLRPAIEVVLVEPPNFALERRDPVVCGYSRPSELLQRRLERGDSVFVHRDLL